MSANYVVVVDSTTDMPSNLAEELGLTVIPYIFTLDGKEYYNYLDYRQLSVKDFYNTLRDGKLGSTTQVTLNRYLETWEPILKEGKDVLYMCLSSQLSKSYEQSVLAAKEAMANYPGRKVIAIDTKSACMGQALLAYYSAKYRDEGKSLDENAAAIEGLIPRLQHWVMADDLHHLRRGGRVSGAAAFVGSMLNVKPILSILPDGKLTPLHKVRGRGKALALFIEEMEKSKFNPKDQKVFIAHSDAIELAEQLKSMITEKFGTKDFVINDIGPVIGSHTGPGTLALFFLADSNRPAGK